MVLYPCGHRVLIKPEALEDLDPAFKSAKAAGIVLDHSKELERERDAVVIGTVVSVGPTAWKDPSLGGVPWACAGDRVYYAKYAGKKVKEGDNEYLILNDEDIVATIGE